jgi:hypothetical protein
VPKGVVVRTKKTRKILSLSQMGKTLSDETKKRISAGHIGKVHSEETKNKLRLLNSGENNPMFGKTGKMNPRFGKVLSKETKDKISLALMGEKNYNFGKTVSDITRERMSLAHSGNKNCNFGKVFSKEHINNIRLARIGKTHSDITKERMSLSKYDIWYGGVKYIDRPKYCELWNEDLKCRIRAFFGDVSVLSGKTKSDNGNRNMSCHHVYYQKKACCEWDEDVQGYYAIIDNQKYYIKGDPNKFVTLTAGENRSVEKDKLKWVKIFEDIIENEYGGKCYYTTDEFCNLEK